MSDETISVPESVPILREQIASLEGTGISPFREGLMVEMPCCGFSFDAEAIDCAPGPSRVVFPLQWTCDGCERSWRVYEFGLEEVSS